MLVIATSQDLVHGVVGHRGGALHRLGLLVPVAARYVPVFFSSIEH